MAIHIVGFVVTMIVLLATSDHKNSANFVFTTFENLSGWPNDGVAFCIGIMTSLFGFPGVESAAHFSEEIKHAQRSLPRASELPPPDACAAC